MIADLHVVPQVAVAHQEVVVADTRGRIGIGRPVDRHAFADHIVIANRDAGRRLGRVIFAVLRLETDRDERIHHVASAQRHLAAKVHAADEPAFRPDDRRPVNHTLR
ncbi:MAG: hypothetical protein QF735_05575, partial [Phycisphaeraceae bacterium]|nr:hypothetical protein [Phycisphaeraceae bacterium]